MNQMKLKALAKINLGLDVTGKREDGYHEVRMVMQTIHLYDEIDIKVVQKPGIQIRTNLYYLPVNENNLVYKAAHLLMEEFDIHTGLQIQLKKHIPVAAGMAGGSSDAAAVLFGLNRMFRLGLSQEQLMERGVRLGADIPYCIMRGTALAEGIGEVLTPLSPMPRCYVLVAKPGISVSTKFVYGNLKVSEIEQHARIDDLVQALEAQDLHAITGAMGNVLEEVTIPAYPVIEQIKQTMIAGGALNAMMSGSGPTVFGIFQSRGAARQTYQKLRSERLAKQIYLTNVYNNRRS